MESWRQKIIKKKFMQFGIIDVKSNTYPIIKGLWLWSMDRVDFNFKIIK